MTELRNVAIIAHVDHGKTTLVDQLLMQSGMFRSGELDKLAGGQHNLIMDSNPLERERGITILSKNCAVSYTTEDGRDVRINIIDTPGHADFGGEVERVLRMADGCLLLVDAAEGPMPQTRFVLAKAIEAGLEPLVVINKCDKPDARVDEVHAEVFDLLVDLGADEHALNFPMVYAAARDGWATEDLDVKTDNLRAIFESIVEHVPPAPGDADAPLQMLVTTLDYSDYVGRIGIGRVYAGTIKQGQQVIVIERDGTHRKAKVGTLKGFSGLSRVDAAQITAGDICAITGIDGIDIGHTIADVENPVALPPVRIDEPTLTMVFRINDSPFVGQDGKYVTSRQIRDRLYKEVETDVALKIEPTGSGDEFIVSGRGLLHLGILIENMRREGFELAVGKPQVVLKEINGTIHEPYENLAIETPDESMGAIMELIGSRKGEVISVDPRTGGRTLIRSRIPARGLIGLRGRVLTASAGDGVMSTGFDSFEPMTGDVPGRQQGVLVSIETGAITAYSIDAMSDRGIMFGKHGDKVYEGQIIGEHNRENDLTVNITRAKALSNIREANKEAFTKLKPPRDMPLERCLEYIEEDELVEITPTAVRMRKKMLKESERKRTARQSKNAVLG